MTLILSASYLLPIALQELFPKIEILHVEATESAFFCDFIFNGEFTAPILNLLEERMRAWIAKKEPFHFMEMMASNGSEFLAHHGDKKLSLEVRKEQGLVALLRLDRFFFKAGAMQPESTDDYPFIKLISFYPLKTGIRLIGTGALSKDALKVQVQKLKNVENIQQKLESLGLVSWCGNTLIWEAKAEQIKALLKANLTHLYHGFEPVFIASDVVKPLFFKEWSEKHSSCGFLFEPVKQAISSPEPWCNPFSWHDLSWGREESVNSFLHIIAQFLKILHFEYEVICTGLLKVHVKEALKAHFPSFKEVKGKPRRLEFFVRDRLGRKWLMSSIEWDMKYDLIQMTVCASFERCIALMIESLTIETVLNRLKLLEKK
ncbi:hypothetical protein [Rhabdochlamydiaceae symbiont of Dictyostelium giganteum]|uniref:hypothetical protein n=1 Tax=Rhabdochlamydiaceae symbiont of Dictyostelium giganteum TaxID=3342349 RepID=UPI00384B0597